MGLEYEQKFAADGGVQEAIRQQLGGSWETISMRTTYFDTAGGDLSARKWTLRHRLENGVHVCTLKTPMGDARGEWETVCESVERAIPELCKLGGPAELLTLTQNGVIPVCGAEFTRLAATVALEDGTVEVALDSGRLFAGSRETPLCEVEVELKSGSREAADRFATALAETHGLQILTKSKFKRAYALREK